MSKKKTSKAQQKNSAGKMKNTEKPNSTEKANLKAAEEQAQKHLDTSAESNTETKELENTDATAETDETAPASERSSPEVEDVKESETKSEEKDKPSEEDEPAGDSDAEEATAPAPSGVPVHLQPKMGYPGTSVSELIALRQTERLLRNRIRKAPQPKSVHAVREYFNTFVAHVEEFVSAAEDALIEKEKSANGKK